MTTLCATCAVERDLPLPDECPICADERQYLPADGQRWTTVAGLAAAGIHTRLERRPHGAFGLTAEGGRVGIGQESAVIPTPAGSLLWDPLGFIDDAAVAAILELGPVLAIAASHPHMFGVQLEWAAALDAPVLVNAADAGWLGRTSSAVERWSDRVDLTPGLTLHRIGGHFPGSAVAHWAAGADGAGVLFSGDTIAPKPDRRTVSFMRSYPNDLPLSAAVALRIAAALAPLDFEVVVGNFGNRIDVDGSRAVQASAERHAAWVRGDFDHLT